MKQQYYVDIGYNDPTVIYEIKLVKIKEIQPKNSLFEIIRVLDEHNIKNVVTDGRGVELDMMRESGITAQRAILLTNPHDKKG